MLENLLTNAVNAMPEGGTLTIITSLALNLQFHETQETPRDCITIEIQDTGVGISSEMKEKLFQPFTSGTHSGTGLGLTIVKKIIEDHKGHIEFSSEEGTGTSFLIYLPVA
ncbi:MAG: ATP-binding protein [bacterium]